MLLAYWQTIEWIFGRSALANYCSKIRGESLSKANYHSKNCTDQNNRCHENAGKFRQNIVSSDISSKSQEFRRNSFALLLHNTVCLNIYITSNISKSCLLIWALETKYLQVRREPIFRLPKYMFKDRIYRNFYFSVPCFSLSLSLFSFTA